MTEPLCAFSATARRAADVPELMARAFAIFASGRPRPVHVSLPVDVQAKIVEACATTRASRPRAVANRGGRPDVESARRPVIMTGGGATTAARDLTAIAEATGATVVASTAGKGIVPDDHPLSLSASTVRREVQAFLTEADVILAVGTELSETDSFVERMDLRGDLIRVDIDPSKIGDLYPARLGIVADAGAAMAELRAALGDHAADRTRAEARVRELRAAIAGNLTASERRHARLLSVLRDVAPADTVWAGDACQLVYTGAFAFPTRAPRRWFYPAGYCALGNALPNAIGAKMARPEAPVAVLAGDGGFMFTMPELLTAAEEGLSLPVVIWENGGLKQIQDDMDIRGIPRVGVEGINPDFVALAKACHCHGVAPRGETEFRDAFRKALAADRPTVVLVREGDEWLR